MTCCARREGDELVLGNALIERRYRWNGGNLIGRSLTDRAAGKTWPLDGEFPDCHFPAQDGVAEEGELEVEECPADAVAPAHLRATVTFRLGGLTVRRRFRLYDGVAAIACDYFLRGAPAGTWGERAGEEQRAEFIARHERVKEDTFHSPIMERIPVHRRHLQVQCVNFFDITDWRNNLVAVRSIAPYLHAAPLSGNLLVATDIFDQGALFILKEAPCPDAQLAHPGCDFLCSYKQIMVTGIGLRAADIGPDRWTRGHSVVVGVAAGGPDGAAMALREYQRRLRAHAGRRDNMIMLNTWGDRGGSDRISEKFCLEELEAGARLGVTHFQIDSGWQKGYGPGGPVNAQFENIWTVDDYWTVHAERLPRGLDPLVKRSRDLGIELCLWFNPCQRNSYENWRKDAGVLIGMQRRHGIRTFKIDGVEIPDKRAEENLRAMLDCVMEAAGGQAVFNLDVTAGKRFGYHSFTEYGNKFLENRYTDWKNWYPHWTLRNLWQLSRYVPPQSLQVEFLNKWRNPQSYPAGDPLAPAGVPFDYVFALTMMAQPLAWFEASRLPEEAFEIAPAVKTYREHMERIHAGRIFPIGEEPSGAAWTGFQSCDGERGYLLVFRERNARETARMSLWGLRGVRLKARHVLGQGADFEGVAGPKGEWTFQLPRPFTYALYEYQCG